MSYRSRGYSLIELLVACSLFLVVLAIVFLFFGFGTRAFQTASQRQGVQSDALRVLDGLQSDLKRSAGSSVTRVTRQRLVETQNVQRDAICFAALKDWSNIHDSDNFDLLTAQPKWNRYWVYYATNDSDLGQMIRLKVDPSPPPVAPIPLPNVASLLQNDPQTVSYNGQRPDFSYLARNVLEFSVTVAGDYEYLIILRLRELAPPKPGGGTTRLHETYELRMGVHPENTYPPKN